MRSIQETQRPLVAPYAEWIARFDTLSESDRRAIARHVDRFANRPTFSVIMPIFATDVNWLREGIESAQRQLYPAAELCIALGPAAAQAQAVRTLVETSAAADPRIRITDVVADATPAAVANAALSLASGEFAVLFDPRHVLSAQRIRHLPLVLHYSRRKADTTAARLDHDSAAMSAFTARNVELPELCCLIGAR